MTLIANDPETEPDAGADDPDVTLARVRAHLVDVARRRIPVTYLELANSLRLSPPHTIHRVTVALERLMEEDAQAGRPFIAALAISKARGALPAPGFFDRARRLGRFKGDPGGPEAEAYHAAEFKAAGSFWGTSRKTKSRG